MPSIESVQYAWLECFSGDIDPAFTCRIPNVMRIAIPMLHRPHCHVLDESYQQSEQTALCMLCLVPDGLDPAYGIPRRKFEWKHEEQRIEDGRFKDVAIQRPGHPQRRQHGNDKADRSDGLPQDGDKDPCAVESQFSTLRQPQPSSSGHIAICIHL